MATDDDIKTLQAGASCNHGDLLDYLTDHFVDDRLFIARVLQIALNGHDALEYGLLVQTYIDKFVESDGFYHFQTENGHALALWESMCAEASNADLKRDMEVA